MYEITPQCQEYDLSPLHRKKPAHRVMCGRIIYRFRQRLYLKEKGLLQKPILPYYEASEIDITGAGSNADVVYATCIDASYFDREGCWSKYFNYLTY